MELQLYIPGMLIILAALLIMLRLMHYAGFYAPSYFFWTGIILAVTGIISLVHPLSFLFILNRAVAFFVTLSGIVISAVSLLSPVKLKKPQTAGLKIDQLMPDYSFNEFHKVTINASPEKVKEVLQSTGVKDIPAAHLLMKIRGISGDNVDISDRASNIRAGSDTFHTPDFNFFIIDPSEYITLMIIKSAFITDRPKKPAPPEISSPEQFISFSDPGYVKVAMNFRFTGSGSRETVLATETRVRGISRRDSSVFGRYWRIIYPGSAIIRRVWLDTIKKRAEKGE